MNWLNDLNIAKEESLKTRKPILLQFEMDGCGGCKKLYDETYTDPKVAEEMTEWFVLLKLDLIKDREIRKELAGYWTPSIYFLDHTGKSYFNFNGFLPAEEFRILLRLGFAETQIPKGKYAEASQVMTKDLESFSKNNPLLPKLLYLNGIANYIKSKDKSAFMKVLKDIQIEHPNSLEAKMNFFDK